MTESTSRAYSVTLHWEIEANNSAARVNMNELLTELLREHYEDQQVQSDKGFDISERLIFWEVESSGDFHGS